MDKQQALFDYTLRISDNSLILGHRLSEWCGHGPILEEDIALINIALDLIGQSRSLYDYACEVEGKGRTQDDLAYRRDVMDFKNCVLVEQPNGDFGVTLVRQLFYSTYQYFLYQALKESKDDTLAAIAEKSLKEVSYHLRHASDWVVRLGDGTEESHDRVQKAVNDLWMFTDDIFSTNETDKLLVNEGIAPDLIDIKAKWDGKVREVLQEATLTIPTDTFMLTGGHEGRHTEHLGYILAEMQFLPRAYPDAKW